MKRIDRLAARIAALTVKQDAEQNWPRFILHLSDGSTAELVAQLPKALMQLADLHIMPEREVLSIDKPEQLDSLNTSLWAVCRCLMQEPPFCMRMIHTCCHQKSPQRMKRYPNEITI